MLSASKKQWQDVSLDNNAENQNSFIDNLSKPTLLPYSHIFLKIQKCLNLISCTNTSIMWKFRIHPSIPIVESKPIWCPSCDVDFSASYSFNMTLFAPISFSGYIPSLEFYQIIGQKKKFIGFCILPFSHIEVINIYKTPLQFIYRDFSLPIQSAASSQKIGTVILSFAFGFQCHSSYFEICNPHIFTL